MREVGHSDKMTSRRYTHPLEQPRDYLRQLERAIAFFAAQRPVPAARDELQAKLDAVTAEQDPRSRLAGA